MPKSRRRKPHREATRRGPAKRVHAPWPEDDPLIQELRWALRTDQGSMVPVIVGSLMEALTRRPFQAAPPVTLEQLVDSFIDIPIAETTAFLTVLMEFVDDTLLRQRLTRELAQRRHPMPPSVADLHRVHVTRAARLSAPPYDDELIVLETARTPLPTLVVGIDANMACVVEAFPSPTPIDEVGRMMGRDLGEGTRVEELSLADARACLAEAVELGEMTVPPPESETWPDVRPFLKFLLKGMPEGGTGRQVDPDDLDTYQRSAVRTIVGTQVYAESGLSTDPDSDDVSLVDNVVWLSGFLGYWEPLRWSPLRVEALLLDLAPRKIFADRAHLLRLPDVLAVVVRAAAEVAGMSEAVLRETLATLEDCRAEYAEAVAAPPQPGDYAAQLARAALGARVDGPDGDDDDGAADLGWDDDPEERRRRVWPVRGPRLVAVMGGEEALDALDVDTITPHVPRPLAVDDVPVAVRDAALAVDGLVTDAIEVVFDDTHGPELLAVVRTMIERLARLSPDSLRRGKPATTAAALCWAAGRANDIVGSDVARAPYRHPMSVGPDNVERAPMPPAVPVADLLRHFGVSSSTPTRAATLMERIGLTPSWPHPDMYALGDPTLLTSNKLLRTALERDTWRPAEE